MAQQSVYCHLLRWYSHLHHSLDRACSHTGTARSDAGAANAGGSTDDIAEFGPVCPAVALPPLVVPRPIVHAGGGGRAQADKASAGASAQPAASSGASGNSTACAANASGKAKGAAAKAQGSTGGSAAALASAATAQPATADAASPTDGSAAKKSKGKDSDAKSADRAAKNAAKQVCSTDWGNSSTCITGSMHGSGCGHPDCLSFDGLDVTLLWLPAPASASPALHCACIAQHCWLQSSLMSSCMFNPWCWHGCRRQRRQQRPQLTCCASRSAP